MPKDDYIITPVSHVSWDVYNEKTGHLYRVDQEDEERYKCNCPHWYHRLRHTRGACKHILMVKEEVTSCKESSRTK